jgi:eukaryotic-like serine/threonine-protein kinase
LLAAGTKFGRYQIVRALGIGGMGVVYEALHSDLHKRVAVKVMQAEVARNEQSRKRFLREGEAAARIRHPHVVDVSDVGTHEGDELPFLVMEYLEGEDLGVCLAREGPLSLERTVDLLLPVLAGVAAGHAQGVIHRDLKPSNIFLSRGWDGDIVPKVLDFGVSKLLDPRADAASVTSTGSVCGTVRYMSPEQARGVTQIGPATDQYSLGEVLYECLTGHQAYPGESSLVVLYKVATGDFRPPRQLRPDLPPGVEEIILRAMRTEPTERHGSVVELGRVLLPFASARGRVLWAGTFQVGQSANVHAAAAAPAPAEPTVRLPPAPTPADDRDTMVRPAEATAASPPPPPAWSLRRWLDQRPAVRRWVAVLVPALVGFGVASALWIGARRPTAPPASPGPAPAAVERASGRTPPPQQPPLRPEPAAPPAEAVGPRARPPAPEPGPDTARAAAARGAAGSSAKRPAAPPRSAAKPAGKGAPPIERGRNRAPIVK